MLHSSLRFYLYCLHCCSSLPISDPSVSHVSSAYSLLSSPSLHSNLLFIGLIETPSLLPSFLSGNRIHQKSIKTNSAWIGQLSPLLPPPPSLFPCTSFSLYHFFSDFTSRSSMHYNWLQGGFDPFSPHTCIWYKWYKKWLCLSRLILNVCQWVCLSLLPPVPL